MTPAAHVQLVVGQCEAAALGCVCCALGGPPCPTPPKQKASHQSLRTNAGLSLHERHALLHQLVERLRRHSRRQACLCSHPLLNGLPPRRLLLLLLLHRCLFGCTAHIFLPPCPVGGGVLGCPTGCLQVLLGYHAGEQTPGNSSQEQCPPGQDTGVDPPRQRGTDLVGWQLSVRRQVRGQTRLSSTAKQ